MVVTGGGECVHGMLHKQTHVCWWGCHCAVRWLDFVTFTKILLIAPTFIFYAFSFSVLKYWQYIHSESNSLLYLLLYS